MKQAVTIFSVYHCSKSYWCIISKYPIGCIAF